MRKITRTTGKQCRTGVTIHFYYSWLMIQQILIEIDLTMRG
jgi:hypothetical protein